MKFDNSRAESQYALLSTNLNAFVIQVISQYEQEIMVLQTELQKHKEELVKLRPKEKKEKPKNANT